MYADRKISWGGGRKWGPYKVGPLKVILPSGYICLWRSMRQNGMLRLYMMYPAFSLQAKTMQINFWHIDASVGCPLNNTKINLFVFHATRCFCRIVFIRIIFQKALDFT